MQRLSLAARELHEKKTLIATLEAEKATSRRSSRSRPLLFRSRGGSGPEVVPVPRWFRSRLCDVVVVVEFHLHTKRSGGWAIRGIDGVFQHAVGGARCPENLTTHRHRG